MIWKCMWTNFIKILREIYYNVAFMPFIWVGVDIILLMKSNSNWFF